MTEAITQFLALPWYVILIVMMFGPGLLVTVFVILAACLAATVCGAVIVYEWIKHPSKVWR